MYFWVNELDRSFIYTKHQDTEQTRVWDDGRAEIDWGREGGREEKANRICNNLHIHASGLMPICQISGWTLSTVHKPRSIPMKTQPAAPSETMIDSHTPPGLQSTHAHSSTTRENQPEGEREHQIRGDLSYPATVIYQTDSPEAHQSRSVWD